MRSFFTYSTDFFCSIFILLFHFVHISFVHIFFIHDFNADIYRVSLIKNASYFSRIKNIKIYNFIKHINILLRYIRRACY